MSVEDAVRQTIAREPALVRAVAGREPKAWGALAARGVITFRDLAGRAPSDGERRAIWDGLWRAVEELSRGAARERDLTCGHPIDERHHAVCEVCDGMRLCIDCARTHLCTSECASEGCVPGLCVKEVREGRVATAFGMPSA